VTVGRIVIVGNLNVDQIMGPLAPWPRPGTEVVVPHYELRVGGSAGNSALALQALGVPALVVANVGNDLYADWLRDGIGVDSLLAREAVPTTISVGFTHPDGERTFVTNDGHIARLDPGFVAAALERHVVPGSFVLFCGAYLMPSLTRAYPELFALVKAQGGQVALDTGWPPEGWIDETRASLRDWSGRVDHLLASEVEVAAAAGESDLDAAARLLRRRMAPGAVLVVKRGPLGAMAWTSAGPVACPAPKVEVVDTIGAGDVFNAAYLAALSWGADLAAALRAGVETASRAISTYPRQYALPEGNEG
jgi:sugar/nucleoside kinase (ribokinase family)